MALLVCRDIHKGYGHQTVLAGVNLQISAGERIGLVGPNGSGKTTLLRIIAAHETPDIGRVVHRNGLRIGYLPQEPQFDSDETLAEAVAEAFADLLRLQRQMEEAAGQISLHHGSREGRRWMERYERLRSEFEAADGYRWQQRLAETLRGVGLAPAQMSQPVRTLSGGQKCRAALAKVLLGEPDLLLLDEPTNHLDLQGVAWLEGYLATFRGAAVIVSHDRYLLDRVASNILELDNARVRTYKGNYTAYAKASAAFREAEQRRRTRQQEFIRRQREYIERIKANKKRAGQAAARRKMIERIEQAGESSDAPPAAPRQVRIRLSDKPAAGDLALRFTDVSKAFGENVVIRDLSLDLYVGDRLGVVGPNGVGKTTLLRLAVGRLKPDQGRIKLYRPESTAYYDQQQSDLLEAGTVLQEMWRTRPGATQSEIRSYLAPFGFRGEDVFKPIAGLSGGQRSRLILAKLVWSEPQLLLLDEPTNHLDIPCREALEEALRNFGGTVVLVTHDRYLLDKVVTKLLVLEPGGRHTLHHGNYSDYAERQAAETAQHAEPRSEQPSRPATRRRPSKAPRKAARAEEPNVPRIPYELQRLEPHQIEAKIEQAENELADLQERFGDPAVAADPAKLQELQDQCEQQKQRIALLYAAWERKLQG